MIDTRTEQPILICLGESEKFRKLRKRYPNVAVRTVVMNGRGGEYTDWQVYNGDTILAQHEYLHDALHIALHGEVRWPQYKEVK